MSTWACTACVASPYNPKPQREKPLALTFCHRLDPVGDVRDMPPNHRLDRAADFIDAHCTGALQLDDICAASGLSPSYLIRAFKTRYGMTPH
ncbi:MAG: hypothetical protein CVU28_10145, partial [Betaproteobacteria bacterium HGW-Betaproteobacteria-21]